MEKYVDLCVVGAAGSGLSSAIIAKDRGIENVLILEKMKTTGGCSKIAGGIFGIDTPTQKRQGLYYSADEAFQKLITILNWNVDAKLVRKWIKGCGESIRWLEELGVVFDELSSFNDRPDITYRSYHTTKGMGIGGESGGIRIVRALLSACEKRGIEIMCQTRAQHLIRGEDGRVCGVVAQSPDGQLTVRCKAVVLATGSISANKDLLKRFYGTSEYDDVRIMANVPHNTGDGLIMAEEIGGKAGRINTLFIGPHNHFPGASEVVGAAMRRPELMKVTRAGERFIDEGLVSESQFGWMKSVAIDHLPGKICYAIMDKAMLDAFVEKRHEIVHYTDFCATAKGVAGFGETDESIDVTDPTSWTLVLERHLKKEEEAGRTKICGSIEEIAEYLGCDPETLQETFDNYNRSCENGYDEEFLKRPKYLMPLKQPPYYVINGPTGIDTCIGGLTVDNHQRVLDMQSRYIPGLYAAGVLCSGFLNGVYAFFGTEMSFTIYSGRSSGEEAAKYIKQIF